MYWGWLDKIHRPCIGEDDIAVVDLFASCFLYDLIGEKDPIPDVIVDRITQRVFGL